MPEVKSTTTGGIGWPERYYQNGWLNFQQKSAELRTSWLVRELLTPAWSCTARPDANPATYCGIFDVQPNDLARRVEQIRAGSLLLATWATLAVGIEQDRKVDARFLHDLTHELGLVPHVDGHYLQTPRAEPLAESGSRSASSATA